MTRSPLVSLGAALLVTGILLFASACGSDTGRSGNDCGAGEQTVDCIEDPSGDIIDLAIASHGGDVLDSAEVRFTFRGADFVIRREGGRYRYVRVTPDTTTGQTRREILTNDSLYVTVGGTPVKLTDEERQAVLTRVNSVTYFALQPYFLQDPAVQSSYSGTDSIEGTPYHRIRVTFRQEGGGPDFEDVFYYWFDTETHAMDYLAYAYGLGSPDEEAGTRFREAYDVRRVNGVRFADYRNYTYEGLGVDEMTQYPALLQQDSLDLVSTIETDSVQVEPLGEVEE